MKGFIIDPTYEVIEDKAYVYLYGRLENGQSFLTINEFKPYFYIKEEDLEVAEKLNKNLVSEKTSFTDKHGKKVTKILFNIPAEVPKFRKKLEDHDVETYEADIKFPYRFMMDLDLKGSIDIEGDYETGDKVDRVYKNPELQPTEWKPKLKLLSMDIETNTDTTEIYCISIVTEEFKKVLIISDKKLKNHAENVKDEEELLEKFISVIQDYDPDIITGWNLIDFDLAIIQERCKKLKVPFVLGRDNSKSKLRIEEGFFRDSKADVTGRAVLDGMQLLSVSFIKLDDYKLGTAAQTILKDDKLLHFGQDKFKELDDIYHKNTQLLVDYNLKDSELVVRILEKSGALDLSIQRSLLTGMPLDRVNASIASLDSLYIREARKRKLVVPSGRFAEKEEQTTGGYVREAEAGIYDYIIILDFKSIYPSIIRTFNIDPLSYVEDGKGKNLIKAPNGASFKNEEGILPCIIQDLWQHREIARKQKNELARYAIKIHMNSFYGVLASPACRFFNPALANAITHFGHAIIKLTAEKIEDSGYKVIYQDTDSNFVVSKAKSLEEAEKIGKKIEKDINDYYKQVIKKDYKRESHLELSFDKVFIKCLMPKVRGGDKGAKKRYAGLILKDGKEEIQYVGLETVRSDWTEIAKKYQQEVFERIFHNKEIADYTKKFIQDIKKGKYNELLVYRKNIRKDLKDYTKSTPPHVKAARQLDKLESNIIEYVITVDGPEPIQKIRHALDYEHYIEKQIRPIAETVLIFFNKTFEDLIKGDKQATLF